MGKERVKVVVFENWGGGSVWGKREGGLVWRSWSVFGVTVWCRRDGLVIRIKAKD